MTTPTISNWRVVGKGALVASFTVTLPSGMIVNEIKLFAKDGKRWLGMPSRKFTTSENTEAYAPLIQFIDRAAADQFRDSVIAVIDEMAEPPRPAAPPPRRPARPTASVEANPWKGQRK